MEGEEGMVKRTCITRRSYTTADQVYEITWMQPCRGSRMGASACSTLHWSWVEKGPSFFPLITTSQYAQPPDTGGGEGGVDYLSLPYWERGGGLRVGRVDYTYHHLTVCTATRYWAGECSHSPMLSPQATQ